MSPKLKEVSFASRLFGSIVLVLLVTALRLLLSRVLGDNVPFILYFPSVILIAWYAGSWCAVVATLLASALAAWLFVPTSSDPLAAMRILLFIAGSALIIWVAQLLRRNQAALMETGRRAEIQRRRYEVMLDSIAEGVVGVDANGAILFLNHAAKQFTAVLDDAALGRPLLDLLQLIDEDSGKPAKDVEALQDDARRWSLVTPGREPLPVALSISRMRSDVASANVVLVLRAASAERERERMVAETESARADAEAANRMKDDFLRMVSHELRAPLNAILGWADVMLRKNDPATVTKGAETIRRNVRAQSSLIDSMLDVAAIASGRFTIARRPTDLYDVIEEARRSIEPIALTKKITLIDEISEGASSIHADPGRLQQVLANLYSNAIKFTPAGGSITTRLIVDEKSLVIEVQDTGQGMSEATSALLFERSARDSALARSKSGLGLGLRIARRIAELHGGQLSAESPGENLGTTVRVSLPIDLQEDSAPLDADSAVLARLQGLRVLVVDDDSQAALLLANVLEDLGATVTTADDARRALDLYQRFQPDALLSDLGMPEEDGYWLMKSIRAKEAESGRSRMPALAVSAYSRPEDRERSRQAGFNVHLVKPMAARAVAQVLAESLRKNDPPGSNERSVEAAPLLRPA
jgi:signal transduction histidine kinase/FixJ family two-component response regulator